MEDIDQARQLIVERADVMRLSLNELSRRLGRNSSYLHQYIHRGTPKLLSDRDVESLANILGVPEHQLRQNVQAKGRQNVQSIGGTRPISAGRIPSPFIGVRDLPLVRAQTAKECVAMVEQMLTGELVARPVVLAGVLDAFAVRVPDGQMAPVWRVGDTVYFHPGDPATDGDGVAVETRAGARIIGRYLGSVAGEVLIGDWRDGAKPVVRIAETEIKLIAREVGILRR